MRGSYRPGMPLLVRGDARALPLPDGCVDLIVTSPPYFGLRCYTDAGMRCPGQLGGEASIEEFLQALVGVTAELVRVLKPSGSMFVNLGDRYEDGTSSARTNPASLTDGAGQGWHLGAPRVSAGRVKSLLVVPERYRIACVDELGLIARAVIVWSKPNPLPESVGDRVRRSHEEWVHLVRQPRYYAAVDEIRQPLQPDTTRTTKVGAAMMRGRNLNLPHRAGRYLGPNLLGTLPGSVWSIPTQPLDVPAAVGVEHFAAFPMEWPRRLILGWSPHQVCTACGQGRRPAAVRVAMRWRASPTAAGRQAPGASRRAVSGTMLAPAATRITGYRCACPEPTAAGRPGVVLDPFGGAGTTALVAAMLGRVGISVDLSGDYARLAAWRATDARQRARAAGLDPKAIAALRRELPGQLDLLNPGGAS